VKFYRGQMRVSGCNNHYEFVLSAGAKAKTMTTCPAFSKKKAINLLIILTVL
jgi:hypothetical protein